MSPATSQAHLCRACWELVRSQHGWGRWVAGTHCPQLPLTPSTAGQWWSQGLKDGQSSDQIGFAVWLWLRWCYRISFVHKKEYSRAGEVVTGSPVGSEDQTWVWEIHLALFFVRDVPSRDHPHLGPCRMVLWVRLQWIPPGLPCQLSMLVSERAPGTTTGIHVLTV